MKKSIHSTRSARSGLTLSKTEGSILSFSSLQTQNVARVLAKTLLETQPAKGAQVLALVGELGSGKTTFAQGLAKGLGIKEKILSPTFILLKEFNIRHPFFRTFYHIDCYRLDNPTKELLH
jgi:tRNA threonylcarbamoyladenosine biosynthesis protein TsaE